MPNNKPPAYDIFISYRIADSLTEARLLFTDLSNHFGEDTVFLDKKRLEPGMEWPKELEEKVQAARVLLVLIKNKTRWLGVDEEGNRRIDQPGDWVRREVETAFDRNIEVIPILIDGAWLPSDSGLCSPGLKKLRERQAVMITNEHWDKSLPELVARLEKQVPVRPRKGPPLHPLAAYPLPADLDPLPAHASPYLGLRYFDREAAPLFFGRTRETLAFMSYVENPEVRLICLFGHSGVGKSSFLAAGILPRLDAIRPTFYCRRNKAEGLHRQLEAQNRLHRDAEKPPVILLDQAEEMFTDRLPGEQEGLVKTLAQTLSTYAGATVVLGFRNDYLLEMQDLLSRTGAAWVDLPLRALEQPALKEAIEGVWRQEGLRQRYRFELEAGFADFVARDLMQSETGGAASILQNRLLKLFLEAGKKRTAAEPRAWLRIDDYRELKQNSAAEEELLDFQIQRLLDEGLAQGADERSLLEVLERFVVDKPTAGTVLKKQLPEEQSALRDALRRVNLLSELPENEAIRLSHDLLAPVVRRRYSHLLADETERLELENVRLRLREVHKRLMDADFIGALEELRPAALRNVLPLEVWPPAYELAFVLLHAGKRDEGLDCLFIAVDYLVFAHIIVPPYPDTAFPDGRDNSECLDFLRRCDPAGYIRLEQRYFPLLHTIPGGSFDMGDVLDDREYNDETPHPVTLSAYELAETPVTWYQYSLYCLANGIDLPDDSGWGKADRPVINVNWYDATAYANWLSRVRGLREAYHIDPTQQDPANLNENSPEDPRWLIISDLSAPGYRLPTEAEWEFAARAVFTRDGQASGGGLVRFGNGKNVADPAELNFDASGAYKKDYSKAGEYRGKTTPVKHFGPNALKLYDMSGNVYEWCGDWYGSDYYQSSPKTNPAGPASGSGRVVRGGSWFYNPPDCRVAVRGSSTPGNRNGLIGFRLARTL